ncbi:THAP domain-containing protein, partial [Ooceraea biroi]
EGSRHCNLVFDSMAIRKQVLWNATSEQYVGLCDYGNGTSIEAANSEATEVLVFMLVSLRGTWKWPVGYFVDKINAVVQAELVKTALILSQRSGIRVWSVTCDGAHANYSTMNILGCNLYTTNYCELKSTFKHPSSDYDVHFVPDACHNVKLARNMLGDLKIIKSPTAQINWNHITNLHTLQLDQN